MFSVLGDIIEYTGGVQYTEGISGAHRGMFSTLGFPCNSIVFPMTFPHIYHDIPRCTHDIPQCTEHPQCTHDIPRCTHDIPRCTHDIPRCTTQTLCRVFTTKHLMSVGWFHTENIWTLVFVMGFISFSPYVKTAYD